MALGASKATLKERLSGLAEFRAVFERPDFLFGEWSAPPQQMPYFSFSPPARAFIEACNRLGWVTPTDWMKWLQTEEGKELSGNVAAIAAASAPQLENLLTALIRGERFCDGRLDKSFRKGILTAIVRRAEILLQKAD